MGGRGKTPIVGYLARRLLAAGERPAILSRGYGRRQVEDGVVVVSDGVHLQADLDRAGDEPLMLARTLPGAVVLVCEQRAIAAALASRVFGATVLLLDDGFQHRAMRRDVDLVVVSASDLRGRRLPFGPLRENPSALRRADAVIIDGDIADADRKHLPSTQFVLHRQLGTPIPLEPRANDRALDRDAKVVALAGIANPQRFSSALEAAGWHVGSNLTFRDHHRYSAADLLAIANTVRSEGADAVLTTEKDAIRLLALRPLPVPVFSVPLIVTISPSETFDQWLMSRLRGGRK